MLRHQPRIISDSTKAPASSHIGDWHDVIGHHRYYGSYGMNGVVAVLYGLHLTAIASLNTILWRLVTGPGFHPELAGAAFPLVMFVLGTIVAAIEPNYAAYFWVLAFGGLFMRRLLHPRGGAA